jgi:hypothetical protein
LLTAGLNPAARGVSTLEPVNRRKVIVAGMIGNALEWYDFSVYGYFVGAIGQHFFPREDHTARNCWRRSGCSRSAI